MNHPPSQGTPKVWTRVRRAFRVSRRVFGAASVVALTLACQTREARGQSWKLVWADEFNQPAIDTSKWNFETGGSGWGNNELQYYTNRTENAFTSGGLLVIRAQKENYGGKAYTSARMTTKAKGDWAYGRVDVRARLPYGQGIWPAIWMMPTDSVYGGWPASGEIDIMELLGHDTKRVYGTLHYAGTSGEHLQSGASVTTTTGDFSSEFHVFSLVWTPTQFTWLVDGVPYQTQTFGKPFNQRFHMILNTAVGGNWPGNPDLTTVFPQLMQVDYVRVYEDPSARPWNGSPAPIPGTVKASEYDRGGEGIAYHDSTPGANEGNPAGNTYRTDEGVDTQPTVDASGGFNVGWVQAGEWMDYTVDVATTGMYTISSRVAALTGGTFHIEFAGTNKTGALAAPATGNWQSFRTVTASHVPLNAGVQRMRIFSDTAGINYNWVAVAQEIPPASVEAWATY